MQAEQPTSLCYPRRKMRVKVGMFGAVQFLNVLILKLLCVELFNSVNVTQLSPVWERLVTRLIICYFVVC